MNLTQIESLLLRQHRWCSASHLFCSFGVSTCQALLRNIRYKFISWLNLSVNSVVVMLVDPKSSDTRYQSAILKYWYDSLLLFKGLILHVLYIFIVVCFF